MHVSFVFNAGIKVVQQVASLCLSSGVLHVLPPRLFQGRFGARA